MNKKLYNNIFIAILLFSDFLSGTLAFGVSFDSKYTNFFLSGSDYGPMYIIFCTQLCWSVIFFFANLYNPRATLSRFDEIIRLVPIIYSVLFIYITFNVFGLIKFHSDYKSILAYGIVFSTLFLNFQEN